MKPKIMFVDNNVDVLKALKRLFQDEPYHSSAFEDPSEALNQIKKTGFAVVMVDQYMREMSGAEFLKMVKQISPNTVRAIMTVSTELKTIIEAINKGYVNQFVLKPLDGEELKQDMQIGIGHYEMRVANRRLEVHGGAVNENRI